MKKTDSINLTEGIIWKQLLLFFLPILMGTFFQQFYNTVDTIIVGRFVGKNALAAVGGSVAIIQRLIVGVFLGLSSGASVIISQFTGKKDPERVEECIHTIYAFSIIGSLIIMVFCILMASHLLIWMKTPDELMADSLLYLRIYFAGILFVFIYNAGSAILRALGDSRRPLYYLIVCAVLNIILDLVLVIVFKTGVAGVALATVMSQAVSSILVTRALMITSGLSLRKIRFHRRVLKLQFTIGIPYGIEYAMYDLPNMVVQTALNTFGTNVMAAWAAYGKIDAVYWMISSSIGATITTFTGQNYGAGRMQRTKKGILICMGLQFVMAVALSGAIIVFREPLLGIFTDDAAVIEIGGRMMCLISPWYFSYLFIEVFAGALRGIGNVMMPLIMTIVGVGAVRVLWVMVTAHVCPTLMATIANYPVTWVLTAAMFTVYFIYYMKKASETGTI